MKGTHMSKPSKDSASSVCEWNWDAFTPAIQCWIE